MRNAARIVAFLVPLGVGVGAARIASAQQTPDSSSGWSTGTTTTPTTSPVAPVSTAGAPAATADPASFNMELKTMEEDVNALKEQVFRSKAILQLLKEIVVQGTSTGSRATVWHVNKLGPSYTIESVAYYLDGQGRFSQSDSNGELNGTKELKVYDGAIPPGTHTLTTTLKVRGNGMGLFSYVESYTFTVQASNNFEAEEGKSCQVRTLIGQRKGIARSFTERVNVTFETRCEQLDEGTD